MWKLVTLIAVLNAFAVSASVIHEKRGNHGAPIWRRSALPDKEAILRVRIGLTQRNLDKGYDHVMNIAHPSSKQYGKHWTPAQIQAEFAPASASVQTVSNWLREEGISDARLTSSGGWVAFSASVGKVEQLLNATYFEYEGPDGSKRVGCDEYSVPESLVAHVDYITPGITLSPKVRLTRRPVDVSGQPLLSFPSKRKRALSISNARHQDLPNGSSCAQSITPACLQSLYNLPNPSTNLSAFQLGLFEQVDEYAQQDLDKYFSTYAPHVPQGTHPILVSIDNGTAPAASNSTHDGGESDIDLQTMYGLLGPVNVTLYQTLQPFLAIGNFSEYDATFIDPFLAAIDGSYCNEAEIENGFQCGTANLTNVVSASYSLPELGDYSLVAQQRVCNEFMKYSLRGHTFVFASGDSGVGQYFNSCNSTGCRSASGGFDGQILQTNFPANCPYVLTVGATQLESDGSISAMNIPGLFAAESGCVDPKVTYSSGGGFANYFSQPSYQQSAVEAYLSKHDPGYKYYEYNGKDIQNDTNNLGENGGLYNRIGRGYPDVSANGRNFASIIRGEHGLSNGTSLAAPLWASIIALLNEERQAVGKGPVGFINPTLYANPSALIDVIGGNNSGCDTDGFTAVAGWDPITGLGTPNYTALHEVFMDLP